MHASKVQLTIFPADTTKPITNIDTVSANGAGSIQANNQPDESVIRAMVTDVLMQMFGKAQFGQSSVSSGKSDVGTIVQAVIAAQRKLKGTLILNKYIKK